MVPNKRGGGSLVLLCMIGLWSSAPNTWSEDIPWTALDVKTDTFSSFFPETYKPGYQLAGFQGYEKPYTIELNVGDGSKAAISIIRGRRAVYGIDTLSFPLFRVSLEEMRPADYEKNRERYVQHLRYLKASNSLDETTGTCEGYEYVLLTRSGRSFDELKGKKTVDIATVFVPKHSAIISVFFFNAKYYSNEPALVDSEGIIRQLIDRYVASRGG